jgi:hypothetical protein
MGGGLTYLSERKDERGDGADEADTVEVGSGDGDVTNMDPLKGQQGYLQPKDRPYPAPWSKRDPVREEPDHQQMSSNGMS